MLSPTQYFDMLLGASRNKLSIKERPSPQSSAQPLLKNKAQKLVLGNIVEGLPAMMVMMMMRMVMMVMMLMTMMMRMRMEMRMMMMMMMMMM